jgi:hypothetical protein
VISFEHGTHKERNHATATLALDLVNKLIVDNKDVLAPPLLQARFSLRDILVLTTGLNHNNIDYDVSTKNRPSFSSTECQPMREWRRFDTKSKPNTQPNTRPNIQMAINCRYQRKQTNINSSSGLHLDSYTGYYWNKVPDSTQRAMQTSNISSIRHVNPVLEMLALWPPSRSLHTPATSSLRSMRPGTLNSGPSMQILKLPRRALLK